MLRTGVMPIPPVRKTSAFVALWCRVNDPNGASSWSSLPMGRVLRNRLKAVSGSRVVANNYCWVFQFQAWLIQEVREYMDTQLVTERFGADGTT